MRRWRYFFSRWQNWLGFWLVLFFVVMAIAAPVLSPMDARDPEIFKRVGLTRTERLKVDPQPPSDIAPLGTLPYQYDVFHTLVWGSRDALRFGLLVVLISGVFGVVFGAIAGYAGGIVNTVMIRVADAFLAFPVIAGVVFLQQLMAVAIEAAGGIYFFNLGNLGPIIDTTGQVSTIQVLLEFIDPLMLSLILFSWMPYTRLVNSMVLSLKSTEFIQASRALGASSTRTIFRHLIPNSIAGSIVLMARDVGGVVILQATLTFIQLGGNSPWGDMLYQGRNWILNAGGLLKFWWVYIPATAAVMLFGIAWNLLGDGLNDILDPTAHYGIRKPSVWSKIFGRKQPPLVVDNEAVSVSDILVQEASKIHYQAAPTLSRKAGPYSSDKDPVLLAARNCLSCADLPLALHSFQHLIRRGRQIEEIIPDLAALVKKYPHDPQVWQTLGDALRQAGDESHAAQSHERARELMR
jgi:peptide/nickel transport system permease protein